MNIFHLSILLSLLGEISAPRKDTSISKRPDSSPPAKIRRGNEGQIIPSRQSSTNPSSELPSTLPDSHTLPVEGPQIDDSAVIGDDSHMGDGPSIENDLQVGDDSQIGDADTGHITSDGEVNVEHEVMLNRGMPQSYVDELALRYADLGEPLTIAGEVKEVVTEVEQREHWVERDGRQLEFVRGRKQDHQETKMGSGWPI